jgi:hypothetical protein
MCRYSLDETLKRWINYQDLLRKMHAEIAEVGKYPWTVAIDDSVGILETRILAMLANMIIERRQVIPMDKWVRRIETYAQHNMVMKELLQLVETYSRIILS